MQGGTASTAPAPEKQQQQQQRRYRAHSEAQHSARRRHVGKKKQDMVSAEATLVALKAQYDRLQQDNQQLRSRDTELLLELLR